ncbi:MAG TPA: PQQ-dependent sugar dehydrogenase, partial [Candidatus Eisenbacteria bacterium]
MRRLPARMAAILMAAFMFSPLPARALTLPPGFVAEDAAPGSDLVAITAIAFMPDGRLIATEKTGYAWIIQNGAKLPQKLWDGSLYVNASGNGGLTGVAVDPHYAQNHYVYFAFTMDPDSDLVDAQAPCYGRVVRFQTAPWDSNQVDFTTGTVLLGRAWGDGVPAGQLDHVMDGLRFAPDGSLFVSAGDGASADFADAGGHDPDLFLPGRTDPAEDIGAFRAQYVRSLAGKILRIDPASGAGYPSNPYFDGDPQSNVSKIWEYGLRNPWRWCFRPGTGSTDPADGRPGTLFIGDVGWTAWEEIDIAPAGGMNFGWPCEEGFYGVPGYLAATPAHTGCGSWGGPDNPAPPSSPVLAYSHTDPALGSPPGFIGNAIMGGLFYEGSIYPPEYHDRYFFADYGAQWIRVATFDAANALVDVQPFATDAEGPVDFAADPVTGDLFYVAINTSHVYRLRYSGPIAGDRPPVAHATGSPLAGLAPLTVTFSSAGTSDPDQDPLALGWNFGDGLGSGDPNPVHRFDRPGVFDAVLTADDLRGGFAHDTVRVVALESGAFPSTALLDDFDRADGALGAPWTGEVDGFTLASQALELTWYSASVLWSGAGFAPEQEAYVTFAGPGTRLALLLDTQGPTLSSGALLVRYEAPFGQVTLMTLAPGRGWETWGSPIPAHYDAGDQFGARAYGNGVVEVLRNGAVIGSGSVATWPLVARGGGIGLLSEGPPGVRFDDFGGGSTVVSGNLPPRATILAPQDGAFFAAGDTIRLAGAGSDDRDPPGALAYHWDVDLAHNNHIHPQVFT